MKRSLFMLGLASLSYYSPALAQQDSLKTEQLMELSLEDLMNITVTTASKNDETKTNAPAIISVISAKDIEGFGALSMKEVLDRVAGVYVNATYFSPTTLSMRGDHTGLYDTHVLLLLNGRPVRESLHNGANMSVYEMFPVSAIERIEIIKGPGSVIYGTSAYTGVINIITKEVKGNAFQGQVRYGSFQTRQASLSGTTKIKGLEMLGAIQMLKDQGWTFTARDERAVIRNKANTADSTLQAPKSIPRATLGLGALVQAKYKDWRLNASFNTFDQRIMGRSTVWGSPIELAINNVRGLVDVGYAHTFSEKYSTAINLTYNFLTHRQHVPLDAYHDDIVLRRSNDVLAEWTHSLHPTKQMNLLLGVLTNTQTGWATQPELNADGSSFDLRQGTNSNPFYQLPRYSQTWFGAYLQADYALFQWLKLVAGGQLNKVTGIEANFVPRVGSIFTINSHWSAKAMYGQAFRSPSFFERGIISIPNVVGNGKLTPEVAGTLEGQVTYVVPKAEISITYFRTRQSNLITRSNVSDSLYLVMYKGKLTSIPTYINRGTLNFQGVEAEGKAHLGQQLTVTGSITSQASLDNLTYGMPTTMVKLGLNYQNPKGVGLGLFNSYFGKGKDIALYDSEGHLLTKQVNGEVKAFHYLTANLNVDFFKIFQVKKAGACVLNVYGVNLLNSEVNYPELVRRTINSIPGRPGRSAYIGLSYAF